MLENIYEILILKFVPQNHGFLLTNMIFIVSMLWEGLNNTVKAIF